VLGCSTGWCWWGTYGAAGTKGRCTHAAREQADASFASWPHASRPKTSITRLYCALLVSCRIAKEALIDCDGKDD
jgi:hypothetical protein